MPTFRPDGHLSRPALSAASALAVVLLANLLIAASFAPRPVHTTGESVTPVAQAGDGDRVEAAPVIRGVPVPAGAADRGAPERAVPQPLPPATAVAPGARIPLVDGGPRLEAFAGLSTWIDLYDTGIAPADQAAIAAASGVQTVFVQTARYNSPADIHDPARLGELLEAAHDLGLRVVTWYIADHLDVELDLRRSQAAIAFTSPRGDQPDAFGLDIETEHQADVAERTRQLLELSRRLRDWTGPAYPMAAIVLPPLQLDLRPTWWPAFPYAELTAHYDVFVPMSYSSFRGTDAATTYSWNLANVTEMRVRAGDLELPVHLAGGIANELPELGAFVQAAADAHVLGAGLYDLHTTGPQAWPALQALRAEG